MTAMTFLLKINIRFCAAHRLFFFGLKLSLKADEIFTKGLNS